MSTSAVRELTLTEAIENLQLAACIEVVDALQSVGVPLDQETAALLRAVFAGAWP